MGAAPKCFLGNNIPTVPELAKPHDKDATTKITEMIAYERALRNWFSGAAEGGTEVYDIIHHNAMLRHQAIPKTTEDGVVDQQDVVETELVTIKEEVDATDAEATDTEVDKEEPKNTNAAQEQMLQRAVPLITAKIPEIVLARIPDAIKTATGRLTEVLVQIHLIYDISSRSELRQVIEHVRKGQQQLAFD